MDPLFLETFPECRLAYQGACSRLRDAGLAIEEGALLLPSGKEAARAYSVDFALFAASPKPAAIVLLTCGLHGAEGYAGSAVMRDFLLGPAVRLIQEGLGVAVVHGMNPFGFDHFRRTTESNVDLNRNFDFDGNLYDSLNQTYGRLHSVLCPARPVGVSDLDTSAFGAGFLAAAGMPEREIAEGVARGQYTHERGLYFGGNGPEPLALGIQPVLRRLLSPASLVLSVDLHTGFGRRGALHFFPDASARAAQKHIERLFLGYAIDWGDTGDFYSVTGEFVTSVAALCPADCVHVPMVFELGTLDSHTSEGGLLSIHTLALENQAHFHGCQTDAVAAEVRGRFREMFFPAAPAWRESVRSQVAEALRVVLPRLLA